MSPGPTLNYVNLFVCNLDDLPTFYSSVFGFREIESLRNAVFVALDAGGAAIGFMAPEVYGVLGLEHKRETAGSAFLLNIEVESTGRVDELVTSATAAGARLVKDPATTGYGWYQAVLEDPEGNVFRINHILGGAE